MTIATIPVLLIETVTVDSGWEMKRRLGITVKSDSKKEIMPDSQIGYFGVTETLSPYLKHKRRRPKADRGFFSTPWRTLIVDNNVSLTIN